LKTYHELKAEIKTFQQQIFEVKKNERAKVLKKVKRLCKEFDFPVGTLKGLLVKERKQK